VSKRKKHSFDFLSFGATPGTFSFFARKKRGMAENPLGAIFFFLYILKHRLDN